MDEAQATADAGLLRIERAGFWRRFGGAFIDGLLLAVVNAILSFLLGGTALRTAVSAAISLAYFTFFHGRTGQTPGNAALSIKVVDLRDGTGLPIGYSRAALRWLVSIVSFFALLVGYLWMLWDGEKQTWHDKVAGSVPVDLSDRL